MSTDTIQTAVSFLYVGDEIIPSLMERKKEITFSRPSSSFRTLISWDYLMLTDQRRSLEERKRWSPTPRFDQSRRG